MEFETLKIISDVGTELGLAAIALFVLAWQSRQQSDERQKANKSFMDYIESNNHQKTDLIKESTRAMTECKDSLRQSTVILKETSDEMRAERLRK